MSKQKSKMIVEWRVDDDRAMHYFGSEESARHAYHERANRGRQATLYALDNEGAAHLMDTTRDVQPITNA